MQIHLYSMEGMWVCMKIIENWISHYRKSLKFSPISFTCSLPIAYIRKGHIDCLCLIMTLSQLIKSSKIKYNIMYYILISNKGMFVWPIWPEAKMGLDFVSGQYGCLFSRCRKYVINSLIDGHFHNGLVINPRPILRVSAW